MSFKSFELRVIVFSDISANKTDSYFHIIISLVFLKVSSI